MLRTFTVHPALAWATALFLIAAAAYSPRSNAITREVCSNSEVQQAASAAKAGDVISMCAKTWTDTTINLNGAGTADQPIVLKAAVPGKTVLTGATHIAIGGKHLVVDGLKFSGTYQHSDKAVIDIQPGAVSCRVTNVVFDAFNPTDLSRQVHWVMVRGTGHRVDHSYFYDKRDRGIMVALVRPDPVRNDFRADHNYFAKMPENAGSALGLGTTGEHALTTAAATAEYNLFENIHGDPEIIMNKSSGNTIRGNVIRASSGSISLRQGDNVLVTGNYIFGESVARSGGVRVSGDNHRVIGNVFRDHNPGTDYICSAVVLHRGYSAIADKGWVHRRAARNTIVAWNTVVHSGEGIVNGAGDGAVLPSGTKISNNIFESPIGDVVRLEVPLSSDTTFAKNIVHNGQTGLSNDSGFLKVAPALTADQAGVYRLTASSPAINAAASVDSSTVSIPDIDGESRGSSPDIGADEFSAMRRAPVTACEVGPSTYRYGVGLGCAVADESSQPNPPTNLVAN